MHDAAANSSRDTVNGLIRADSLVVYRSPTALSSESPRKM